MASSNKSSKSTKSQRRKTRRSRRVRRVAWGRWAAALVVLVVLVVGSYSVYLGKTVRVKFEGKRWAVPAQIYARPLELFVGAPVAAEQLEAELRFLGYRHVGEVFSSGQWSRKGRRFVIHTRAFTLWDGPQPAQRIRIDVDGSGITGLRNDDSGRDVDLFRLEPGVVGSIYPAHREDRVLVRRADLPDHLVQGLLAVEDRRFFEHSGVDLRGIARALQANIAAGRTVQGGSSLTQQLVKNFLLTPERSLTRKINEALMALIVESRYSKDEILEAYANEIFLGQDGDRAIHGFGLAAHFYFGRPLAELQLHETALLVALVKGASFYNPRRHPERARDRRNLVIDQMEALGMVDAATAQAARDADLEVTPRGVAHSHRVPAFVDLVRRQLRRDYREEDLTSEGLRIFSTLDPWVQQRAEAATRSRLAQIEGDRGLDAGSLQSALVVVAAQHGEVEALVGGRDNRIAGFNRALDAVRPIGSLVKPAVYLAALSRPDRFSLVTPIEDAPIDLALPNGQRWQPQNYDRQVHGKVALHDALARSLNLATVHLGLSVGLDAVVDQLKALGVKRDVPAYPSILLGAVSLSPLEVAQVYQTLASGGFRAPLKAIREVLDAEQRPLRRYPLTVTQAAEAAAVFLLTRNLAEVTERGTAAALRWLLPRGLEVAGKTGTTNDLRDSWFAGFSADRVAVVWVGRDDNGSTGLTGSSGALPVWAELMGSIDSAPLDMRAPPGVAYHWVDTAGRLAAEQCEGAVAYPFIAGSEPAERSDCLEQRGLGGFLRGLFD
jgi:penicillin-binding protein 1B